MAARFQFSLMGLLAVFIAVALLLGAGRLAHFFSLHPNLFLAFAGLSCFAPLGFVFGCIAASLAKPDGEPRKIIYCGVIGALVAIAATLLLLLFTP